MSHSSRARDPTPSGSGWVQPASCRVGSGRVGLNPRAVEAGRVGLDELKPSNAKSGLCVRVLHDGSNRNVIVSSRVAPPGAGASAGSAIERAQRTSVRKLRSDPPSAWPAGPRIGSGRVGFDPCLPPAGSGAGWRVNPRVGTRHPTPGP